nr:hypothetical protein BaRGS_027575 [Batillaria attramentaria]
MDALSVGIIIIVGCVVFLFISAILIYQNAQTEAKLLKVSGAPSVCTCNTQTFAKLIQDITSKQSKGKERAKAKNSKSVFSAFAALGAAMSVTAGGAVVSEAITAAGEKAEKKARKSKRPFFGNEDDEPFYDSYDDDE